MSNEVKQFDNYSLMAKAEIDMQISTAKAFPRDLKQCIQNSMTLATMSQEIAENCVYALPRGQKVIEGPSVRLAEIVSSQFGNCRSGARIIDNDGKTITAQGVFHDLETNNSVTVEVKRSILQNEWKNGQKTGKMITMNEDMQVIVGNAACAIAFRNAVFKGIPAAFIDPIFQKCKEAAKGDDATLPKRRDSAIAWFHTKGIDKQIICDFFSIQSIEEIDIEMLSQLSGFKSAVVNDAADIKEIFGISKKQKVDEKKKTIRKKKDETPPVDNAGQAKIDLP